MLDLDAEWLEADGLGGFASGTVGLIRTRRYHGLLLTATTPPTGRRMLVNGCEAWLEGHGHRIPLSAHRYSPDVVHPDGHLRIARFDPHPWPTWTFAVPGGAEVSCEVFVTPPRARTVLRWRWLGHDPAGWSLHVRPLLSGRDYHALHHENAALDMRTASTRSRLTWRPYASVPAIGCLANGRWRDDPQWYRHFLYRAEQARGLDDTEDLASPGELSWNLVDGPAMWIVGTEPALADLPERNLVSAVERIAADEEHRRRALGGSLARSADAYLVTRGTGRTIVAGYPWFTDWGRDTFIAMRGLCLATGRFDEAREILLEWSRTITAGLLPNRFPDEGDAPELGSVDAALWFIIVAHEVLIAADRTRRVVSSADQHQLRAAILTILEHYAHGTRFGIRCTTDGLLAAGDTGASLTWMDARVNGAAVTPRVGKPVEIQALWINALEAGARIEPQWVPRAALARAAFEARFWNVHRSCLFDVVDVDHEPDTADGRLRPNQILAVGGLPWAVLTGLRARQVVDAVEQHLWTPLGLRTLGRDEPGYVAHYEGGPAERDAAYHQGAVWAWLLGPFVEAWIRVRGGGTDARTEARTRFLAPLHAHLAVAGLGHVSELADAEAPHTPRGCPFQAWSLGELLRIEKMVGE